MKRAFRIGLALVAGIVVLAVTALMVFTGTNVGRERVRRAGLAALASHVHGRVSIGRIEGNLLGRFALIDVSITDSAGSSLLVADTAFAAVDALGLLSRRITITDLELVRPVIRLVRPPAGEWNYRRIFPARPTAPADTAPGFGDWIWLQDVRLRNGQLVVQIPWAPDTTLAPAARDSVVRLALSGASRSWVDSVAGGLEKTMDFFAVNGHLANVVLATPRSSAMTLQVVRLQMTAAPFRPPVFDVRNATGTVRMTNDSVTIPDLALELPGSRIAGRVAYLLSSGDATVSLTGRPVALADLRGLYPPLPDSGGGPLDFDGVIRTDGPSDYVAKNARLTVQSAGIGGSFGIAIHGDTMRIHDTELHLRQVPTTLVERFTGHRLQPPGTFTGSLSAAGPLPAMRVAAEGTFDPSRKAPFRVSARGGLGLSAPVRMAALHVRAEDVPVALVREYAPNLPVDGSVTAEATITGSPSATLTGPFNVVHRERGVSSRVYGVATARAGSTTWFSADLHLDPVSLELVRDFAPRSTLQGTVSGTARVEGTPRALTAHADLVVPGGGTVVADGHLNTGANTPSYDADVRLQSVDLHAVDPSLAPATVNGTVSLGGTGTDPATMDARLNAVLRDVAVDSLAVQRVAVRASARDGMLTLDTLDVRTAFASASASGRLGLDHSREGTIAYRVDLRDVSGLRRWIGTGDTSLVASRPGVQQRLALLAQSTDSARRAAQVATDVALLAQQSPAQRAAPVKVPDVPPLRRDSLSGAVRVDGTLTGRLRDLTARGTAQTSGVVWNGSEIGRGRANYTYAALGTSDAELRTDLAVDSLRAVGFAFDSTRVTGTWRGRSGSGSGNIEVSVFPGDTALYRARADYVLHPQEGEIHLQDFSLRFDSVTWVSPHPSAVSWRGHGLSIDTLELRTTRGAGHILVNGDVPDVDQGTLLVEIDGMRVAPWLTLLQSDIPADGQLSFTARLQGTRAEPRIHGALTLSNSQYANAPFPDVRVAFTYDARHLSVDGSLRRSTGYELARISGTLPVDLSRADSTSPLLPDAPIQVDITGDSIPLSPLAQPISALTALNGWAHGTFGVRGTYKDPRLEGALDVNVNRLGIAANGVTLTNAVGRLHMSGDTLVLDSVVARSGGPISARGGVVLADLLHPVLNVQIDARDARVLNNEQGELFADARVMVRGPIDTLSITGTTTVTRGVVYLPEPEDVNLINTGDPAILASLDSTSATEMALASTSAAARNLRADVDLTVNRGTWARSQQVNVEVYGHVRVRRDPAAGGFDLSGTLLTGIGEYVAYGKRFTVTRGSARFTGDPSINPALQVLATYQVRQAGRPPFDIRVVMGGTMRRPNLTLESDAQPTLSQSDLIAFLAFGQSSTSLLQFQANGLQGGGQSGSSLAGNVSALATRQLAGIALGALLDQARTDLVATTGADVVDITPADLPADLSVSSLGALVRGTEIRIGKYTDSRTFVVADVRPTFVIPGASLERRFGNRFRLSTSFETRYLPQQPSLTVGLTPRTIQVFGALLSWSLRW